MEAASISSSDLSAFTTRPVLGWSKAECTAQKIQSLLVDTFVALVRDASFRKTSYRSDIKVLSKGFWYANEYAAALQEKGQTARFEFFKKRNSFFHGYPPKGFAQMDDASTSTGKRINGYTLTKGTRPSDALNNIRETLCFIDCQELVEIAYYEVLLQVLGQEKFDSYFAAEGKHALRLDVDLVTTPLCDFVSLALPTPIHTGDHVLFTNPPFYGFRHLNGEGRGYHALCIEEDGEKKFTSFGLDFQGLSEEKMLDALVDEFNKEPIPKNSIIKAELEQEIENRALDNSMQNRAFLSMAKTMTISRQQLLELHEQDPTIAGLIPVVLSRLHVKKICEMLT